MTPTAQQQYNGNYPENRIDAEQGNIVAVSGGLRSYGYSLRNTRTGNTFSWYRYKRDAIAKIETIKQYGN